jgi:3-dehydroquinate dehydratase-1
LPRVSRTVVLNDAAMKRVRIGDVVLEPMVPHVIAPFTDRTPERVLRRAVKSGLSLFEARVDLFENVEPAHVVDVLERARAIGPVLATIRFRAEGGAWARSERERLALYRAIAPHADALDVELDAGIRADVARIARKAKRTLVLSNHNFKTTPAAGPLDDLVRRCAKAGADIIKIATYVRVASSTTSLARLLLRHPKKPLVVIGMGSKGRETRIELPVLGSLFTFASIEGKTAPGQLTLAETLRGIEKFRAARFV